MTWGLSGWVGVWGLDGWVVGEGVVDTARPSRSDDLYKTREHFRTGLCSNLDPAGEVAYGIPVTTDAGLPAPLHLSSRFLTAQPSPENGNIPDRTQIFVHLADIVLE